MNLIVSGFILILFSNISYARNQDKFEDDRLNDKQIDMVQERMEEKPSSTTIGGSRGGKLEKERIEDDLREDKLDEEELRQKYDL